MASEAPPFWWQEPDWRAWAMTPFSAVYGVVAGYRLRTARREQVAAPVLCVGNFTVGGEGKTPVALALARAARKHKRKPGFLSRGYGSSLSAPHLVDAVNDSARVVGDEPLLLAREAPVAVTPDRAAGARRLIAEGCDFLIMDDGFQSARIHFDYALIAVDAGRGLGNGHVIPAGPMRATLIDQLRHADAVVRLGAGRAGDEVIRKASRAGLPVFDATLKPKRARAFKGRRFLAFAGIGNPRKFFGTLADIGGEVVVTRTFPDHHPYADGELDELSAEAEKQELSLITTAKDAVRLNHGTAAMKAFAEKLEVLEIEADFELADTPRTIIGETIEAWRERSAALRGSGAAS